MWQYAADLVRGGKTYSQVHDQLSMGAVKERFGLLDVPHPDTIRYQLKRQELLEQKRLPSALYPEDRKSHERGLSYLALALGAQASAPASPETGPISDKRRPNSWTGFVSGTINLRPPEEYEELEVSRQWASGISDPRELSHFEFLIQHLQMTVKGKNIVRRIDALFEVAEAYSEASGHLWDVLRDDLTVEFQAESEDKNVDRRCGEIFDALHPTDRWPQGQEELRLRASIVPALRVLKKGERTTPEVFRVRRLGPEHMKLVDAWEKLDEEAWKLERSLTPSSQVRRLVQDGQCSICALGDE